MQNKKKVNLNKINLFLDIAIVLLFVVQMEEPFVGLYNHERLGLMLGAVFAVHITLHWRWVVGVTKQFFQNLFPINKARLKYALNLILLIDMAVCIISGILISRTLGLNLVSEQQFNLIGLLHVLTARLSLLIVGLHIASSWEWVVVNAKKYLPNFAFHKQANTDNHPNTVDKSINVKIPVSR
jgi:hypothetical protein